MSENAITLLLSHKEEDIYVDYKENFDPKDEKEWAGLTKDVMAFSNTEGGYIVFGVKDATFDLVGLSLEVTKKISDINFIQQKLNRFVAPPFTQVRSKKVKYDDKHFVIWHLPQSIGKTHIIIKDFYCRFPSGERKLILWPGMIFIRRSGSNHIVEPSDLDFIIERRIEHYKSTIFNNISRVIEASQEQEVFIVTPSRESSEAQHFVISDAPDAIPIKGMSFTVTPETDEQEISCWIALSNKDPEFEPGKLRLWHVYHKREEIELQPIERLELAKFCILSGVPMFYWIRGIDADLIKDLLQESMKLSNSIDVKEMIIQVGAFLGKGFHTKLTKNLKSQGKLISLKSAIYPALGPRYFFPNELLEPYGLRNKNITDEELRKELEKELSIHTLELSQGRGGALAARLARTIDCYLYAQDDRYKN